MYLFHYSNRKRTPIKWEHWIGHLVRVARFARCQPMACEPVCRKSSSCWLLLPTRFSDLKISKSKNENRASQARDFCFVRSGNAKKQGFSAEGARYVMFCPRGGPGMDQGWARGGPGVDQGWMWTPCDVSEMWTP